LLVYAHVSDPETGQMQGTVVWVSHSSESVTQIDNHRDPRNPHPRETQILGKSTPLKIKRLLKDKDIKKTNKFTPPTLSDVTSYCEERNNSVDPQRFIDHYEASGWIRGKTKIKSWKACVRTWEKQTTTDNEYQQSLMGAI